MDTWLGLDARPRMNADEAATYERRRARGRSRELVQTTIKVMFFYLACVLVDMALLGDVTALSVALRFGLMLPLAAMLLIYQLKARPIRHKEYVTLGFMLAANLVWCVITATSANPMAIHYFYAAVLFQMVVTIGIRAPFRLSLAATLVCFLINYGFISFVAGWDPIHGLYHLAIYIPTVVQTLIASYQLEAERLINFVQMYENETLKQELSRQNDALERLALTDPLTQLPNRRGTDAEVARLRAHLAPREIGLTAILIIDIDHFKAFNDGYGHAAGDACLARVARSMRRELPGFAHLARHGGEEFLAIIPHCGRESAARHAESLRRRVRAEAIAHEHAGGPGRHVTISIGVACGSIATDAALDELLQSADRALYEVKADGRNGWRLAETADDGRALGVA